MILLLLIGLGLILGSFVNAFVWRLHEGKDWVRGRSECSHCHHQLAAMDLIPVLSWLWLRGNCRYCKAKIDDTPLPELVLPVLFTVSFMFWPLQMESWGIVLFVLWCIFLVGFVALALYDFKWFLLPDKVVFPLAGLAVVYVAVLAFYQADPRLLFSAVGGVLVLSGTFYLLFQISRGTWIGGGDVKLGLVLGLLAGGILQSFLLLFIASVVAMVATLPLIMKGRAHRKSHVPFGPFLIAAAIIVVLFGDSLLNWYTGLLYV